MACSLSLYFDSKFSCHNSLLKGGLIFESVSGSRMNAVDKEASNFVLHEAVEDLC